MLFVVVLFEDSTQNTKQRTDGDFAESGAGKYSGKLSVGRIIVVECGDGAGAWSHCWGIEEASLELRVGVGHRGFGVLF